MMGGVVRAAEALLRGSGGRTVLVRMPAPAVAGDVGEQLGLDTPQFQDFELGPVVFRKSSATLTGIELVVSAAAVKGIVGSLAYDSAKTLFKDAMGIVVDEDLLEIEWVRSSQVFGAVYLYQLGLRGSLGLVV